jgi:hypothetical protein
MKDDVTEGRKYIMRTSIIFTLHPILLGRSNERGLKGVICNTDEINGNACKILAGNSNGKVY